MNPPAVQPPSKLSAPSSQPSSVPNTKKTNILLRKYEMSRVLGHGRFAKVHEARSLETGAVVAIKQIEKRTVEVNLQDSLIVSEVTAMHRLLNHPNIINIIEVMATKSKIFIVMEYACGGDLFTKFLRQGGGKFSESKARRYFQQLVSALNFCHRKGIAHRDLKPENLLLDKNGNIKVSDFGLSALPERLNENGLLHTSCGTPAYAAPEVMYRRGRGGRGYDGAKADAWSCGVILYVLLTGSFPFDHRNLVGMSMMMRHRNFKFPECISKSARNVIYKLLDPNPETRISLEMVTKMRWFQKHLATACQVEAMDSPEKQGKFEFESINAFDIISFSSGLDLSGLFEAKKRREKRFTVLLPLSEIAGKVKEIGEKSGYRVVIERSSGKRPEGAAVVRLRRKAAVLAVEAVEIPAAEAVVVVAEMRVVDGDVGDEEWEELKWGLEESFGVLAAQ